MREVLVEMGYCGDSHRSQGISRELLQWADKVVCMGNVHERFIQEHFPEFTSKVTNWLIKDPHFAQGTREHRVVAEQLKELVLQHFG